VTFANLSLFSKNAEPESFYWAAPLMNRVAVNCLMHKKNLPVILKKWLLAGESAQDAEAGKCHIVQSQFHVKGPGAGKI